MAVLKPIIKFARRHRIVSGVVLGVCALVLLGVAGSAIVGANPVLGARGAEVLRGIIGDENVARLETWVLGWQDRLQSWAYDAGADRPQAPFSSPTPAPATEAPTALNSPTPSPASDDTPASQLPTPAATVDRPTSPPPTPTAAPANQPAPLKPMGQLAGEGAWSVYLQNTSGQPVGFRTFLEPDPQRAYAVAGVVALDLSATRLYFLLGALEPVAPGPPIDRPGRIPANDLKSGLLLAAFNGGFRAHHGQFGAMVNGVVALAPRPGFGTVAMYDDGHVAIGAWGTDINFGPGLRNWRQNGPLIIQNGQINPHTADTSPDDWGYTVKGVTAAWRSGLGLSADGKTLYYVAGNYLTLPTLAQLLADTGAANAIQLDINSYWVDFVSIQSSAAGLKSQPLMDGMRDDDRYLHVFERDFFYVMAAAN